MKTRLAAVRVRALPTVTRRAILAALLSLSFVVPQAGAAPWSPIDAGGASARELEPAAPYSPPLSSRDTCLAGIRAADELAILPGRLSEAGSLYAARNRTTSLDNETTLAVIALAGALGETVFLDDITTYHEDRIDVCIFDRLSTFEAESVLGALTLGLSAPIDALRGLVPDSHIVVRFESVVDQRVELDTGLALQALALHGAGGVVHLEDVLSVHQSSRTERTFEARTTLDKADTLLAQALRAPRGG